MISSPFQQKGPRTIPTLPNKRSQTRSPILPSKKGRHEANPFNRKSMQFSQRSSTTESDRFP